MDFELELIIARTSLHTVRARIKNGIDAIREKNPHRTDYLVPMEKSEKALLHTWMVYDVLEKEYRATRQRCRDLEYHLLLLQQENAALKKENEQIKNFLIKE
jgi:hypothetical protein